MSSLQHLEQEIELIKVRNRRVEADKAWELSFARTAFISITTFILLYIFFRLNQSEAAFLNALISTVTYLLSTFTYGKLKFWWLKKKKVDFFTRVCCIPAQASPRGW